MKWIWHYTYHEVAKNDWLGRHHPESRFWADLQTSVNSMNRTSSEAVHPEPLQRRMGLNLRKIAAISVSGLGCDDLYPGMSGLPRE
jgi:hypothetical protein